MGNRLFATASVAALLAMPVSALAQATTEAIESQRQASAEAEAAQAADAQELDTVYVTATRRTERLQDVPLSVSVLSQDELDAKGVVGYEGSPTLQYMSLDVEVSSETPGSNYLYFYPTDADPAQEYLHQLVSLSCQLPPGTGITDTYVGIRLDDAS